MVIFLFQNDFSFHVLVPFLRHSAFSFNPPRPPANAYELCRKQSKVTFSGKFSLPSGHYSPSLYIIAWRKDRLSTPVFLGFPRGSDGKESTCNAGELGSIPGLGRSSGGGHSTPLQYSCLENPHGERSLAGNSPGGRKELVMTEWLNTAQHIAT